LAVPEGGVIPDTVLQALVDEYKKPEDQRGQTPRFVYYGKMTGTPDAEVIRWAEHGFCLWSRTEHFSFKDCLPYYVEHITYDPAEAKLVRRRIKARLYRSNRTPKTAKRNHQIAAWEVMSFFNALRSLLSSSLGNLGVISRIDTPQTMYATDSVSAELLGLFIRLFGFEATRRLEPVVKLWVRWKESPNRNENRLPNLAKSFAVLKPAKMAKKLPVRKVEVKRPVRRAEPVAK
jgi:hypothetical protein